MKAQKSPSRVTTKELGQNRLRNFGLSDINADMKFAVLRFPGKKFQVGLSRVAADKRHGTVVQFVQRP
jgi:hypothetical protein